MPASAAAWACSSYSERRLAGAGDEVDAGVDRLLEGRARVGALRAEDLELPTERLGRRLEAGRDVGARLQLALEPADRVRLGRAVERDGDADRLVRIAVLLDHGLRGGETALGRCAGCVRRLGPVRCLGPSPGLGAPAASVPGRLGPRRLGPGCRRSRQRCRRRRHRRRTRRRRGHPPGAPRPAFDGFSSIPLQVDATLASIRNHSLLRATTARYCGGELLGGSVGRGPANRTSLEDVPWTGRPVRRLDHRGGRRGARPRRPERIRQVDADQGALRLPPARRGASAWADGEPLTLGDGDAAGAAGIRFVHQDLGLVGSLSAVENIALTAGYQTGFGGRIRWRDEVRRTRESLAVLGLADIDVKAPINDLPPSQRTVRGDRPRPRRLGAGRQPARARRADGDAAGRRRPPPVRGRPPPEGAGRVDHLRLAPPRRGVRARRSGHGAARRQAGGHRARVRARSPAPRGADRRPPRRDPHPRRAARDRSTAAHGPRPARWQRARDRLRRLRRRDRRVRRHHGLRTRARAAAARRADPPRRRRRRCSTAPRSPTTNRARRSASGSPSCPPSAPCAARSRR